MYGDRVLVLIPHPDDEVVGAATAIARLRQLGGEAMGLYLTSGVPESAGFWWRGKQRYPGRAALRWQEARSVAQSMGLTVAGRQEIPARRFKSHLAESVEWVRERAKELRPDRVWVPAYEGGHQDHDVANFAASLLAADFDVWEFSEYNYACGRVNSHAFVAPTGDEEILSLDTEERRRKEHLLLQYRSERRNLGYVGVEREAFRPLISYDYARRPHDGPCFYERFQWVPVHPRIDYCRAEEVCEILRDFRT